MERQTYGTPKTRLERAQRRFLLLLQRLPRVGAAAAAAWGLLCLVSASGMKTGACLGLALGAASLFLSTINSHRVARNGCAIAGMALGLLSLVQVPGRGLASLPTSALAVESALGFALLGASHLLQGRANPWIALGQALALAVTLLTLMAMLVLAYGSREPIPPLSPLAIHPKTALGLFLLALGSLTLHPRRGFLAAITSSSSGGAMASRLLPSILVLPAVIGYLCLLGQRRGWYETEFGLALLVVACLFLALALTWRTAAQLNSLDGSLREERTTLRSVLDSLAEGVVVLSPEGRLTLHNRAAESITGAKPPAEWGWDYGDPLSRALRGESVDHAEQTLRTAAHPEGIHLAVTARPIRDESGRIIAAVAAFRNTTEQRETNEALLRNEAMFQGLFEFAPDAILMVDREGRIARANTQTLKLFGYERGELDGQPVERLVPDSLREGHRDHRRRYQAGPTTRAMGAGSDLRGRRKDGTEFPIAISLGPHSVGGEVFTLSIARDISAQKEAERTIRELNQELERRIADLKHTNEELASFSHSVSHDLRAPLRAMIGFSEALLSRQTGLDAEGADYLKRVTSNAQRMAQLIDGLLGLSRLTRKEISVDEVDLTEFARDIVRDLRQSDPSREVDFVTIDRAPATGDPPLLRAVLQNLLGNAWKFTRHRAPARIELGHAEKEGKRVYFVRDNGAGFDMRYADKLFGAFQRLHSVQEFDGIGIGLATVQRIIHRHGGRIWAEGEPDKGATFYFTL